MFRDGQDPGVTVATAAGARMTCVVVDDEAMARRKLRALLGDMPSLECVGEAVDGPSAVKLIDDTRPDLVFLDIRMPGLSGLQVLDRVRHVPRVIFTTAFEEFAVAAFEIQALDYLLKPFSASRLRLALDRARQVLEQPALLERASRALSREFPRQVFVRTGTSLLGIAVDAIERVDGSDDYCAIWSQGRRYLLYRRLSEFAELLEPAGFLRVHRSHIVNTAHVQHVHSADGGRLELTLRSGTVVAVSRSRTAAVREALLLTSRVKPQL